MKEYNFNLDEKVLVWRRTRINVKADSLQEAIKKALNEDYEVLDSNYIYESEEVTEPSKDSPSIEIYNPDTEEIYYSNKKQ